MTTNSPAPAGLGNMQPAGATRMDAIGGSMVLTVIGGGHSATVSLLASACPLSPSLHMALSKQSKEDVSLMASMAVQQVARLH